MGVIPTFNDTHVSSVVLSLSDFDNYHIIGGFYKLECQPPNNNHYDGGNL